MIAVVLGIICVACAAYWLWLWQLPSDNPDEPPMLPGCWPIIGHAFPFLCDSSKMWLIAKNIVKQSYDMGGVVAMRLGPRTVYVITDPDDLHTAANTCLDNDEMFKFAEPWLGEGLLTAELSIWKNHRKLLNPAFSQIVLDKFLEAFNSQSRKLVKALDAHCGKGPFDHWNYTNLHSLETICMTVLGIDFTDLKLKQYLEATTTIFQSITERFMKFWWYSRYTFYFSNVKKKQDNCLKIIHNLSDTAIQRKKAYFTGISCAEESVVPGTKHKIFMDLLLELSLEKNVLSDKQIRDQVDTIIATGHESTGNMLMFTMLLLGSHPEVQEKIYAELKQVLGDVHRDIEKQDLSQLVYLEAVIKESLRIHTVVPTLTRKIDTNIKLKNCTLTSARSCVLMLFGLHRHPIWGPDRNQFIPDRWLDPSRLPNNPNAFAAFSSGKRMCIGKSYAIMLLKTTLAHLVRQFHFKADDSQLKFKLDVVLRPESGYFISIERRL